MSEQILVVKETREGEDRVALTPKTVAYLSAKGYSIAVESQAGSNAGFTDEAYVQAGARLFQLTSNGFPPHTFILRVKRGSPARELLENTCFRKGCCMMGFLSPFEANSNVPAWQAAGLTTFSLELFKSLPQNDPRNVQAAMSRLAGRIALQDALKIYQEGQKIRVTVLGAGAASLSAAFEARRLGLPVQLFGRKEALRADLEKQGITYRLLPEQNAVPFIRSYLKNETIVITAARVPQQKAPLLIDEESLLQLPKGAVVIDLAMSEGGNVAGSKRDEVVMAENDVSIVNVSGYPKMEPREASEAYAECLTKIIEEALLPTGELLFENSILHECWLTHNGALNTALFKEFNK